MDQLTNLYKHKCEQLQEQIYRLTRQLNEVNSVLPTLGTPSLANELGYAPPVNTPPPSTTPPKPTKPATPPPKPKPEKPYPKPKIPTYPWPGAPTLPPKPWWMSDEDYQKLLRNFNPYFYFPTPSPPREGDIGWGPQGSDNYQKYLKEFEKWLNTSIQSMQSFTTEYEKKNPRPTDITSEAYARWLAAWIAALNEHNRRYRETNQPPIYYPNPNTMW